MKKYHLSQIETFIHRICEFVKGTTEYFMTASRTVMTLGILQFMEINVETR